MHSFKSNSRGDHVRQWATIAAVLGGIAVNTVSNLYPPNGINVGEISNTLFKSVLIVPANYAFAIWGVIYVGLIALGIYQWQPALRRHPSLIRGGWLLVGATIAQCLWIYLFLARQFSLSVLAMVGIVIPLIFFFLELQAQRRVSSREWWCLHLPVRIYLGWITVATVVNVALALYAARWDGWGLNPQTWAIIMMIASTAIATLMVLTQRDRVFPLVVVWALVAIAIRQSQYPGIVSTGGGLAIALTLLTLFLKPRVMPLTYR
jgi:hypothetical protein